MKKSTQLKYPEVSIIRYDSFNIAYVECPKCETFIPNAKEGKFVCPQCNYSFEILRLRGERSEF